MSFKWSSEDPLEAHKKTRLKIKSWLIKVALLIATTSGAKNGQSDVSMALQTR